MRKLILISVFAVAAALAGTAVAEEPLSSPAPEITPEITPLPDIDWRELLQDMGEGDHVVGEEMCARPH